MKINQKYFNKIEYNQLGSCNNSYIWRNFENSKIFLSKIVMNQDNIHKQTSFAVHCHHKVLKNAMRLTLQATRTLLEPPIYSSNFEQQEGFPSECHLMIIIVIVKKTEIYSEPGIVCYEVRILGAEHMTWSLSKSNDII